MKRYNYSNTNCRWCKKHVWKGDGVYHSFDGGFTLCVACDVIRDENLKTGQQKKNYINIQPQLRDEFVSDTEDKKGGEEMKEIKRTVKSVEMISSDGKVVMVHLKWSGNPTAAAAGRSWYLDIGGKPVGPRKTEGLPTEFWLDSNNDAPQVVRNWANNLLRQLGYATKR